MRELYNPVEVNSQDYYVTGDGHKIYFEASGNPEGIPVIFLHGGPGSGCKPQHRQYFDPDRYRIIIFDQRGSGRSVPLGHLENNTTQMLLADMEAIREQLGIPAWLVFGGSWGATLALLYAEQYPRHVSALILRGTFLARQSDYEWLLGRGAERFFPEYWSDFVLRLQTLADKLQQTFKATPADIIELLDTALQYTDSHIAGQAAEAWGWWTGRVVTYTLIDEFSLDGYDKAQLIKSAAIELHYARNAYYINENQILDNIHKIPGVPVQIIHGRRDMICTLSASWAVHKALPDSEFLVLPDAGHLGGEPVMIDALVKATDKMADVLTTRETEVG